MSFVKRLCESLFTHPRGVLGRIGGMIMARSNRRIARRAVELLDLQPSDAVLEIGSGPGVGIRVVANATQARWVTGIDPSTEMLEQARARNSMDIEAGRVALRRDSVEHLSFENAVFDKALAIRSMQLWPDEVGGLREIRRVLRPRGVLALAFTHRSGQTADGLHVLLSAAGFDAMRIVDMNNREFFVLAEKPDDDAAHQE